MSTGDGTSGGAIHHSVVIVRDLDTSLRFYRDGLGLEVLTDREIEGDWPGLFDGPGGRLRASFSATRERPMSRPVC
jgi:glyoxylase I family protein